MASSYLSQCWPRSMSPYGISRPQCVKSEQVDYMRVTSTNLLAPEEDISCHRICQILLNGTKSLPNAMLINYKWSLGIFCKQYSSNPSPQMRLKITYSESVSYFPDANELNITWWLHQMETFSALLAICAGNSPVPGEFPTQRPVTRSFDVFFDLRLNKRLSKQSWGWWFETLSRPLRRHCNES